jgi:hypothetical protein
MQFCGSLRFFPSMGIVECRLFLVAAVAVARLAFCGRDENPLKLSVSENAELALLPSLFRMLAKVPANTFELRFREKMHHSFQNYG